MNATMKSTLRGMLAVVAITISIAACTSTPVRENACSLPEGPNLEQSISAARFDLETGCEHQFDAYYQRLLTIAEGDPKKENKASFSEFLLWANNTGLLSKRQARELYNRYFGIKYVSLASDYSVCSKTCPRQSEVMRDMNLELADKEQGLLRISEDRLNYTRASNLYQETELVLEATCEACGQIE
ncbi:MAG: hypothetical protein WBN57_04635 [Gammaproteobacteria bacterium]|jgi:hypothetical protein